MSYHLIQITQFKLYYVNCPLSPRFHAGACGCVFPMDRTESDCGPSPSLSLTPPASVLYVIIPLIFSTSSLVSPSIIAEICLSLFRFSSLSPSPSHSRPLFSISLYLSSFQRPVLLVHQLQLTIVLPSPTSLSLCLFFSLSHSPGPCPLISKSLYLSYFQRIVLFVYQLQLKSVLYLSIISLYPSLFQCPVLLAI